MRTTYTNVEIHRKEICTYVCTYIFTYVYVYTQHILTYHWGMSNGRFRSGMQKYRHRQKKNNGQLINTYILWAKIENITWQHLSLWSKLKVDFHKSFHWNAMRRRRLSISYDVLRVRLMSQHLWQLFLNQSKWKIVQLLRVWHLVKSRRQH